MAQAAPADTAETQSPDPDEARRQAQCAQRWIAELGISEKFQHKWLQRAKKIVKRYRKDDSDVVKDRRFAMLWSNTQTIQPAVYSRPPVPVVTRRFQDADPIARVCSEIIERALVFSVDTQGLEDVLRQCSYDFVLLARGQTWERYVPTHGPMVTPEIDLQVVTGPSGDEEGEYQDDEGNPYEGEVQHREDGTPYGMGQPYKPVIFEQSVTDYVNWEDFGHGPARTWDEVPYVWRRVYLSRGQLQDRFGANLGKMIPLDWGPIEQGRADEGARLQKKAAIYEIWDKASKKVYWISKSWNSRPLDERDDILGVGGFFPCPKPLLGTTANDTVMPVPDYVYYQDQAEEIDKLTARIAELQDAVKVRGLYAGDGKTSLNTLLNAPNNTLIPVPDWMTLKENGGARGMVEWWPIDQVVAALNALIQQRQQLINDVYQITGVADILRGMGDPRATATQEQIKGQWGTLRIRDRQIEMMRFARDILRIKGEVISGKFSADTFKAMTGVKLPTNAEKAQLQAQVQQFQMMVQQAQQAGQPPPQPPIDPAQVQQILQSPSWEDVETLLQDHAMRQFRIDIETDSTIEPNEQQEKSQFVEFISALGQMVQQWGPAVEAQPALAPLAAAVIKAGVRKYRAGRELEEAADAALDAVAKAAAQPKPPPGQPAQPPIDQAKIAVASINQQTEQMAQQAETERTQIMAGVKQQEINQRAQDTQAKLYALPRDPQPQVAL